MSRPLAIIALIAALCWLAPPAGAAQTKGPRIVFEQLEKTFDNVEEGKIIKVKFTFTNQGDQNLIIDKVDPSCGCTASKYDRVTKPGQKGHVFLELDTEGINGSFRKTAAVATNDSSQPVVTLVLLGETVGRIKVDKGRRIKLAGCLGGPITTSATLSDPQGKTLLISGVDNPMKDYLGVKLDPLPGGKAYKLNLYSKANESMEFAGPIFLKIPGSPQVSVWVVASIQGPFSVRPQEVHFGTLAKGLTQKKARSVLLKKACADKLVIDALKYNKELFTVEQHWQKPGEELLLVITPNLKNLWVGPFEKSLDIEAGGKSFSVRLAGRVR